MSLQANELEIHKPKIEELGIRIGIPQELLHTYIDLVVYEWGADPRSKTPQEREIREAYAALIDFSDPAYRTSIEQQNERLKMVRAGLQSTEVGKATIAKVPKEIDDGATVPFPGLPQELIKSENRSYWPRR